MATYRCRCGSFASTSKPCQKCGFKLPNKRPDIVCIDHEWLTQLDSETGTPAMICQICGVKKPL